MIYTVYFDGLQSNFYYDRYNSLKSKYSRKLFDTKALLAEFIRKSENNTFIFILTDKYDKIGNFTNWLNKEKLNNLIAYQMSEFITNPVHPYNGRNLKLTVLHTDKHFVNDLFNEAEKEMENVD